jgi:hypothetical protein
VGRTSVEVIDEAVEAVGEDLAALGKAMFSEVTIPEVWSGHAWHSMRRQSRRSERVRREPGGGGLGGNRGGCQRGVGGGDDSGRRGDGGACMEAIEERVRRWQGNDSSQG